MRIDRAWAVKARQILLAVILTACLVLTAILALMDQSRSTDGTVPVQKFAETDLEFTEICTKNETILADNSGRYRDYVEICNNGEDFDLEGCCLTDGKKKSEPFASEILEKGACRLFFLGDELTGFALGASGGDTLQLLNKEGSILLQVITSPMEADQVMLGSSGVFRISTEASPGFPNTEAGEKAFRKGTETAQTRLAVSEILTENVSAFSCGNGTYPDVVELYNGTDETLNLQDFWISDSADNRYRFRLPQGRLEAGDYILLCCDGENGVDEKGLVHTNFGLRTGESVFVTDRDGSYMTVPVSFPGEDCSMAWTEDGGFVPSAVSLGFPNTESGELQFRRSRMDTDAPLIVSEVLLSSSSVPYNGSFCDVVELYNRSDRAVDTEGWYLSDGDDPLTYAIPSQKVEAGTYLQILCSRSTTGFALSDGELLRLRTPDGYWASEVPCTAEIGSSVFCLQAGEELVYGTGPVSLGFSNDEEGASAYLQTACAGGLMFSEAMSSNCSYLKGAYGRTADWLELYNGSESDVLLSDYTLTDDRNDPGRYSLPEIIIRPHSYCVLLMDDTAENLPMGYEIVPCNLSSGGESLYLAAGGKIIDHMILPELGVDRTYGRPEGSYAFGQLAEPTPGRANSGTAAVSAAPVAGTPQGIYEQPQLSVTLSAPGKIYYTTDATAPDMNDKLYSGPILLDKTTVIRAIAYEDGKAASPVTNLTYLLNEGDELPAVCIVTEPSGLFDPTYGMYMEGPNASPESPHIGANYWFDMEKAATISLFEADGTGFSEPCGLKIFGGYSRALYMKSFSVYFRDKYGASQLDYPLFGEAGLDTYQCFILRAMGQDLYGARMRDVLATSLIAEQTNVPVQKYKAVNVYINERYWGVYFIREKINENYVAGNFNAEKEQVILEEGNGISDEYRQLLQYVSANDLSQKEHYEYVCSQIDVENYMDYIIGEIWIGNSDNGNIKFCKTPDMKWTWIMYDTDWSFTTATSDSVFEHLNPYGTGSGDYFSTVLINGLLENADFRDGFFRRFAWQIDNIWSEKNILDRVDELEQLLAKDLLKDYRRWNRDYEDWVSDVGAVRTFAKERTPYVVRYLMAHFGLSEQDMAAYGFPMKGV